jgi:hypothetical protein
VCPLLGALISDLELAVYATEWTSTSIKIWHFPRNSIPQDIANKKPDPSTWGAPQAIFGDSGNPASCDIGASFYNMSIVLNIVSQESATSPSSLSCHNNCVLTVT